MFKLHLNSIFIDASPISEPCLKYEIFFFIFSPTKMEELFEIVASPQHPPILQKKSVKMTHKNGKQMVQTSKKKQSSTSPRNGSPLVQINKRKQSSKKAGNKDTVCLNCI